MQDVATTKPSTVLHFSADGAIHSAAASSPDLASAVSADEEVKLPPKPEGPKNEEKEKGKRKGKSEVGIFTSKRYKIKNV